MIWKYSRQRQERENSDEMFLILREEVIDVFHENVYIPTIELLSFRLAYVRTLGAI